MRYTDQVLEDLERLGSELEMAGDKNQWRQMVGEAKPHLRIVWLQE